MQKVIRSGRHADMGKHGSTVDHVKLVGVLIQILCYICDLEALKFLSGYANCEREIQQYLQFGGLSLERKGVESE